MLIASTFLIISCTDSKKQTSDKEVTIEEITAFEGELFGGEMTTPDLKKAKELVQMYISYANNNPTDEKSPDLLFKAADISMNLDSGTNTIALFNRIIKEYPNYKNVATVMFLKGFVYEDQLQDYQNAAKCYMEFLEKYPESDFADDAQVSLNNLGKTPEELIKEFEANN